MRSRDIHYGKPTVINAVEHLELFLKEVKKDYKLSEMDHAFVEELKKAIQTHKGAID